MTVYQGIHFAARGSGVDGDQALQVLDSGREMIQVAAIYFHHFGLNLHVDAASVADLVQGLAGGLVILVDDTEGPVRSGQDKDEVELSSDAVSCVGP